MAQQTKSGNASKSSGGSGSRSGGGSRSSNGSSPSRASKSRSASGPSEESGEPDVLLDVAQLKVEEIGMEVESLQAQVAVEARLGDLLHLHVGADVVAEGVALEIKGVEAQAQLKARLDKVLTIIERTLKTVDAHPEVLTELGSSEGDLRELQHAGNGSGSNGESES